MCVPLRDMIPLLKVVVPPEVQIPSVNPVGMVVPENSEANVGLRITSPSPIEEI